VIYIAPKSQ